MFLLLLRQAVVFRQLNFLSGLLMADVHLPEIDRKGVRALADIQPLFLGLPEGHKDGRTVAHDLREEQQHKHVAGPVRRAAQVARKAVCHVGDPRLLPVAREHLYFLYHELRQPRSDRVDNRLIHSRRILIAIFTYRRAAGVPDADLLVVRLTAPPHVTGVLESLAIIFRTEILRIQAGDNFPIFFRRAMLPPRLDRAAHQLAFPNLIGMFSTRFAPQILTVVR